MGRTCGVWLVVAGCGAPAVVAPAAPRATVCASAETAAITPAQIAVAATASGASIVWPGASGVWRLDVDSAGVAVAAPALAWRGTFTRTTAAAVDGEVVVGAIEGDTTMLVGAPLGIGDYRELASIGGVAGASPVVVAGGQRLAPAVTYGGMYVAALDALWTAHTAQLAVLGPTAADIAATAVGDAAVIAWPGEGACYVASASDATTAVTRRSPSACESPRLASTGADVALAFERDGGVYLARAAAPAALDPGGATRIADGTAPRLIAAGGTYWLGYLAASGELVAGIVDGDAVVLGAPRTFELAMFGGAARVVAIDDGGMTVTALCAE